MLDQNYTILKSKIDIVEEHAIFAGGCFWCTEAVFLELEGVHKVVSGYIGGATPNPRYESICSGETGHAEAVQISFDSNVIDYETLLEIFFATHDPTTLNKQSYDIGTQYRSEIFYLNEDQNKIAEEYIDLLNYKNIFERSVVTQISPATKFYEAEDYHQDYYKNNRSQSYCTFSILPKLNKFRVKYKSKLKKTGL
jgi:peptide-methionine (S)-S-oxide reductase